jgi:hypothetical protein
MTLNPNIDVAAIYRVYPQTAWTTEEGAFDADGNEITIDESAVNAASVELQTENNWKRLRTERNKRLAETDYLALSDQTLSSEMTTYRQDLRDLPANTTDPLNPTWPTKP